MEMIRGKLVAVTMIMTMKMMNMKNHILLLEGIEMRWPQREIQGNTNLAKSGFGGWTNEKEKNNNKTNTNRQTGNSNKQNAQ